MTLKILETLSFFVYGKKVDRMVIDANGNDIQVVRCNNDNDDVLLKVNDSIIQTNLDDVERIVMNKISIR